MLKQKLLRSAALTMAVICLFLFAACGDDPAKKNPEHAPSQTGTEEEKGTSAPDSSSADPSPETPSSQIVTISGAADKGGIYSIVVKLTDQAADTGVIEMVYYGAKGSPQENSIVNTFRIEYHKEPEGTFSIKTFFDGEVYQNLKQKEVMTVTNTFGATLRAGSVIVSYTPDGGTPQEVFREDAEYFNAPSN